MNLQEFWSPVRWDIVDSSNNTMWQLSPLLAWSMARGMAYLAALLWINLYICRDLFFVEHLGHMNSMHGFWMAMARLASHHWWRPGWWPYWDAGMPFEWT